MTNPRFSESMLHPAAPVAPSAGFVACPAALASCWNPAQFAWMQQLYQLALERAKADQEPSPWYRQVMMVSAN
jgi:hypothetical protein